MQIINLTLSYKNLFNVNINDQDFLLRINYNTRDQSWYMDLSTSTEPLLLGSKMVSGIELVDKYRFKELGGFGLAIFNTTGTTDTLSLKNFGILGKGYSMFILDPDEVSQLGG